MRATLARQAPGLLTAAVVYAGALVFGTQMETLPVPADAFENIMVDRSLSPQDFVANNGAVLVLMAIGLLTAGIVTLLLLLVNGVLVGHLLTYAHESDALIPTIAGILPHAPFEMSAMFLAAAIGFSPVSVVSRIATDRTVYVKTEIRDLGLLLLAALLLIIAAAAAEAWVSPTVIQWIGGR